MINPIGQNDLSLLLRLIVAHLIADFLFQMDSWVEHRFEKKWTSGWLYVHGALAGSLAYIFAGFWRVIWLPMVIFISHIALDGLKAKVENTARSFLLDQLGHLIVILGSWALLVQVDFGELLDSIALNLKFWAVVLSLIVVIWPVSVWINKITEPWRKEIEDFSSQGLEKAGLWIGRLERILILIFVMLKRFEAVGFLIAAKSIFRFGEIRSSAQRKEAEYILIGTLISFLIAVILGVFTNWILQSSLAFGK